MNKLKTKLTTAGLILVMALASTPVLSQPGKECKDHRHANLERKGEHCNLPNLSSEQIKQLDQLKIKHMKEVLPLHNSLKEKQARLRTLETAEKADMPAINKTIDETIAIRTEIMKKRAAHRQEVRNILTDEQRVVFDSRGAMRRQAHGKSGQHKNCCR